jgi:predicted nuclease of predicted toxin-antitoxin system
LSIAFYFDEHVPRAVAHGLRLRGIDVLTVQDDDLRGVADSQLLDRATKLGRPLFSQDRDLVVEARRRQKEGIAFSGVIYAAQSRVTVGVCVRDLYMIAEAAREGELENQVEFLPL